MVRFFIHQLDGYVGRAVGEAASKMLEEVEVTGTVDQRMENKPAWAKNIIASTDLPAIKAALLSSDVIVYDLPHSQKEVTSALKVLLKHDYEEEKVLIGVSSILSWAATPVPQPTEDDEPADDAAPAEEVEEGEEAPPAPEPEGPAITWKHAAQRKPHPNYRSLVTTENLVLQKGNIRKDLLKTYVVWPGVLYGCGEDILHPLFKCGWMGEDPVLPILDGGHKALPMLHVRDLASLVVRVSEKKPDEQQAFLAVDDGRCTVKSVVKSIATKLQNGETNVMNQDDYLGWMSKYDGFHAHMLCLQMPIKIRFAGKDDLELPWHSQAGFVANADAVTEEFRESRSVTPLRVCILGPPSSGKTFYTTLVSQEYEVPHLLLSVLVEEAKERQDEFGDQVRNALAANPRLSDDLLCQIVKTKLQTPQCRNQGWFLDGFPKTTEQTRLLFKLHDVAAEPKAEGEEEEPAEASEEEEQGVPLAPPPEVVISLHASEEFLRERVMAFPEENVAGTHNDEAGFSRRYSSFASVNEGEETVTSLLVDSKARNVSVESSEESEHALSIIRLGFGQPRNYDPERAARERDRRAAEEKARAEEAERLRQEEEAERERKARAQRELEERERLQEIAKQEQESLETRSLPMRQYLVDNVLPILTKGLLEVGRVRPEDPIDYLAEYLFKHDTVAE